MAGNNKTQIIAEPGKQEIVVIREFDAPREIVFRAFSTKEMLTQWMGPRGMETRYEQFEPVSGGSYRFVNIFNGMEFGFHGVCHEFTALERIIQTFEFEGLPEKGHVVLETSRFEELSDGRTRFTNQSVFQSVADRDIMIGSGMERGVIESYEKLDELLASGILI